MNILWHSNATWMASGFANQTRLFTHALYRAGYGVVISAYRGMEGFPMRDSVGVFHLGHVKEQFNNDMIGAYSNLAASFYPDRKPTDVVISLTDSFAMNGALDIWGELPWCAYDPVDCEPVLQEKRAPLAATRWQMAMSRHGEAQMRAIGLDPLYVPHCIDTTVFKPSNRTAGREEMLRSLLVTHPIPDDVFLVTIVGANGMGDRKNFAAMFDAFKIFSDRHSDTMLYVHAEPLGVHGKPLTIRAEQSGIADRTLFANALAMMANLVDDKLLNHIYAASDVKLMLSKGEGFGISDVESQSAGTPIIATNFSASKELNFTGWKVNGPMIETELSAYQMYADPHEAAERLEDAYQVWTSGNMPALRERTRQAALCYDVETVMSEYMIPALSRISADLVREPQEQWLKRRNRPAPSDKYVRRMEKKKARRV